MPRWVTTLDFKQQPWLVLLLILYFHQPRHLLSQGTMMVSTEVGMKFRSSQNGYIKSVRYYKAQAQPAYILVIYGTVAAVYLDQPHLPGHSIRLAANIICNTNCDHRKHYLCGLLLVHQEITQLLTHISLMH